ncbi:class I SAM-dependent methyltransferase [bacterium]|nr:class I SAM-dependent methyltransferase [candidate division CSSED10-310 bacterium]
MKEPENLSDRIRDRIREHEREHPGDLMSFLGPEDTASPSRNPDTDKRAFSDVRRRYEDELDRINRIHVTDTDLRTESSLDAVLAELNTLVNQDVGSGGRSGWRSWFRRWINRLLRFGLSKELGRISAVNSAVTRVLNELSGRVRSVAGHQSEFNASTALFGQTIVPVIDEKIRYAYDTLDKVISENIQILVKRMDILHEGLDRRQTDVLTWLENTHKELDQVLTDFRILQKETTRGLSLQHRKIDSITRPPESPEIPLVPADSSGLGGYDYYLFERERRGSEETIRRKQAEYIDRFRNHVPVLDIGCGRGEFLELLKDAGLPAKGVDASPEMAGVCLEKGLDVKLGDAVKSLVDFRSGTWGGIFAAQLVEHFPRGVLREWFTEVFRVLKPGGIVCLETINAASPYALFNHYFRDPTHQLPLHPETYVFLLEIHGFENVRLEYRSSVLSPGDTPDFQELPEGVPESAGRMIQDVSSAITQIEKLIYAPCDIVVTGRKPETDNT